MTAHHAIQPTLQPSAPGDGSTTGHGKSRSTATSIGLLEALRELASRCLLMRYDIRREEHVRCGFDGYTVSTLAYL